MACHWTITCKRRADDALSSFVQRWSSQPFFESKSRLRRRTESDWSRSFAAVLDLSLPRPGEISETSSSRTHGQWSHSSESQLKLQRHRFRRIIPSVSTTSGTLLCIDAYRKKHVWAPGLFGRRFYFVELFAVSYLLSNIEFWPF